jgi:hypothetical protein
MEERDRNLYEQGLYSTSAFIKYLDTSRSSSALQFDPPHFQTSLFSPHLVYLHHIWWLCSQRASLQCILVLPR